jgi:hypothetical protein
MCIPLCAIFCATMEVMQYVSITVPGIIIEQLRLSYMVKIKARKY